MKTVGVAVAGLSDLGPIVPVLKALGKKHVAYGVADAHYDVAGGLLRTSIRPSLNLLLLLLLLPLRGVLSTSI